MIVKDGGAGLARCLESARGVADEWVVVDTGSRDDSVARAKAAGATVLHREWQDDFAAARNAGLEAARGEWILLLDADERLEPPSPSGLRDALRRPQYVGYFLPVTSELAGGDQLESTILRLWRHSKEVRFRFPIHEQVLPDLEKVAARSGQRFALLEDVVVLHEGYTPAAIAAHDKVARNLRLFRKAVAQHPGEPYLWYKFADFLRGQRERQAEALAAAERAFEQLRARPAGDAKAPYFAELLTILCASRLEAGRLDEALALLEQQPPEALDSPHYEYVAALACEAAGRLGEALAHVERCRGRSRPKQVTAWRPAIAGPHAEALRSKLLLKTGDARGALEAARRALELKPGWPAAIELETAALAAAGSPGEALERLLAEVKRAPGESRLWRRMGELLEKLGRPEEARRCLARA
jgi:predicted Zn-dependent protease